MVENKSRREFIKKATIGATGVVIGSRASSYAKILGANGRVRVGVIGPGDRANDALIPAFLQLAGGLNFDLVAISDLWKLRSEDAAAKINKRTGTNVTQVRNNDELYEMKDLDAVIIATADFQHAYHCIEAVKAGKDVYVEKPFANTMTDANEALKVVTAADRIVQVGTQRRSTPSYMRANDFIRSGKFGDVVMCEMTWNVNQPGRWRRPNLVPKLQETDVDWKRFLINRPYEPFDARKYVEFRLFWPYSSGIPDQWLVHQIDTVHWFTGYNYPTSVVANGGIYLWRDGRRNFDTMTAVYDYGDATKGGKGFQVVYSSRQTNSAGGTRELYYSNGGMIDLDTNKIGPAGGLEAKYAEPMKMKPFQLAEASLVDAAAGTDGSNVQTSANTGVDKSTLAHMRNWMECVRSRKTPNADIHAAYNHSVALCMTIAALQTGQRVTFDEKTRKVITS
jgi:predicted dehydrogenase